MILVCLFRRTASIAALFCILAGLAARAEAASPEEEYWAIRSQEMARLQALAKAKPDDPKTMKLERAALADLKRRVIEIVGPVHVEGFAGAPRSHLTALTDSPDFGMIDGVEFLAGDGDLVVTTERLLKRWLQERSKPRPAWTRDALKADEFYGYALNPEDGYEGVLDLKLQTPTSASFAAAKLGRWGSHTDSIQEPTLIVTVVKGGRLFIYVTTVAERDLEPPECAAIDEAAMADSGLKKANPEWFGPMHNPDGEGGGGFKDWRACERRALPRAAPYKELTRKAQEIADRLDQAK